MDSATHHRDREPMPHKFSLVVDDESSVRSFITAVLQGDGFQTIEAENGVQALELMRKLGAAVDLLVSDIKMPKMDGITLACSVRSEFPAIPLILVSGYAEIEQAKLPNSGFEFVQLPFHPATRCGVLRSTRRPNFGVLISVADEGRVGGILSGV
jgi:CheY-like chemotaxis protein